MMWILKKEINYKQKRHIAVIINNTTQVSRE